MSVESTIAEINARVACAKIVAKGYQADLQGNATREEFPQWDLSDFARIISDYRIAPDQVEAEIETARRKMR